MKKINQSHLVISIFFLAASLLINMNRIKAPVTVPYYLALNVDNLQNSIDFYQKLGFTPIEKIGGIEENWILMTNGASKIGLYQGMFPKNTITFNPENARLIHSNLETAGIHTSFASGIEKEEGPCFFTLEDPDGNPILIDQHK